MMHMDPVALAAFGMGAVLLVCLMILAWNRDTESMAPHVVAYSGWCPKHSSTAVVHWVDSMSTGLRQRRVKDCSLREAGARCHEECCW